jgi:hypothetical protein
MFLILLIIIIYLLLSILIFYIKLVIVVIEVVEKWKITIILSLKTSNLAVTKLLINLN